MVIVNDPLIGRQNLDALSAGTVGLTTSGVGDAILESIRNK